MLTLPPSSLNFVTGVVSFFIQQGDHGPSDTLTNIRTGNGFVVSIISEPWIANAHAAGLTAPPGVSEWGFTGLTKVASVSRLVFLWIVQYDSRAYRRTSSHLASRKALSRWSAR